MRPRQERRPLRRGDGGSRAAADRNLPGQCAAAVVVGQMATEILALEQRIAAVDDLIAEQLDQHPLAPIIERLHPTRQDQPESYGDS